MDQLLGVNDSNVAVGFYTNAQGDSRGYEYNIKTGTFRRVLLPGIKNLAKSTSLTAAAINNPGGVAGFYSVHGGTTIGLPTRPPRPRSTELAVPGASVHHGLRRQRLAARSSAPT